MSTESIEEIMYGDWLDFPHGYDTVVGVHMENYEVVVDWLLDQGIVSEKIENINPIPLSENILSQMGFRKDGNDFLKQRFIGKNHYYIIEIVDYGADGYGIFAKSVDRKGTCSYESINVEYVHQLQHIFKNCKIELDFDLKK